MATISNNLILRPCALVPQNTVKAPNLHLVGYCSNALTVLFKNGQLLE